MKILFYSPSFWCTSSNFHDHRFQTHLSAVAQTLDHVFSQTSHVIGDQTLFWVTWLPLQRVRQIKTLLSTSTCNDESRSRIIQLYAIVTWDTTADCGGSRISQTHYLAKFLPKTAWKWRKSCHCMISQQFAKYNLRFYRVKFRSMFGVKVESRFSRIPVLDRLLDRAYTFCEINLFLLGTYPNLCMWKLAMRHQVNFFVS